jgi:hypothetical protein
MDEMSFQKRRKVSPEHHRMGIIKPVCQTSLGPQTNTKDRLQSSFRLAVEKLRRIGIPIRERMVDPRKVTSLQHDFHSSGSQKKPNQLTLNGIISAMADFQRLNFGLRLVMKVSLKIKQLE